MHQPNSKGWAFLRASTGLAPRGKEAQVSHHARHGIAGQPPVSSLRRSAERARKDRGSVSGSFGRPARPAARRRAASFRLSRPDLYDRTHARTLPKTARKTCSSNGMSAGTARSWTRRRANWWRRAGCCATCGFLGGCGLLSAEIGAARLRFSQLPSGRKSSAIVCSIEYGDCLGKVISSMPVSFAASSRALR
jgi:hypothetical protein